MSMMAAFLVSLGHFLLELEPAHHTAQAAFQRSTLFNGSGGVYLNVFQLFEEFDDSGDVFPEESTNHDDAEDQHAHVAGQLCKGQEGASQQGQAENRANGIMKPVGGFSNSVAGMLLTGEKAGNRDTEAQAAQADGGDSGADKLTGGDELTGISQQENFQSKNDQSPNCHDREYEYAGLQKKSFFGMQQPPQQQIGQGTVQEIGRKIGHSEGLDVQQSGEFTAGIGEHQQQGQQNHFQLHQMEVMEQINDDVAIQHAMEKPKVAANEQGPVLIDNEIKNSTFGEEGLDAVQQRGIHHQLGQDGAQHIKSGQSCKYGSCSEDDFAQMWFKVLPPPVVPGSRR